MEEGEAPSLRILLGRTTQAIGWRTVIGCEILACLSGPQYLDPGLRHAPFFRHAASSEKAGRAIPACIVTRLEVGNGWHRVVSRQGRPSAANAD